MPSITRRRSAGPGRPASGERDILAATRRLLSGGANFTELGVQQIATEAGVARSTFYAHFRDKVDLVMRLASDLVATSFSVASAWEPDEGVDRMAGAFQEVLGIYREHAGVVRAINEVAGYDATVRDFWNGRLGQFVDRTLAVLRVEQEAGRVAASVDLVSVARIIVIGGERAIVDQITAREPATDAAFARELAQTWWLGVYRRGPVESRTVR
ncbi:TetR/AcrR family transcriptional regulator [Asanoa ferruginea]|uniref:TetR/AcrR family transcriptional regulator n=1 Tax=Asanoa ferruginea TaxID=53367 RepID=UPI0011C12AE3|nr:TetR/AcrR family transcriptional regulator [Asanoa ferruginea]